MTDESPPQLQPLSGLVVADLSTGIAAAYCSKLLADAGATVVSFAGTEGRGLLLDWLDAGKHDARAEKTKPGFAVVVRDQDSPPAWRAQTGGPFVDVVITPFGLTGPWRDRPWSEFTLQAPIGVISPRGRPDCPPVMAGGRLGEWAAGTFAAAAALTGVLWSRRDGRHRVIDVSMFECMALSLLVYPSLLRFGFPDPTLGVELPSVEQTRDGWVGFCTMTPAQFAAFARMIGRDDWAEDQSMASVWGRLQRKDELQPVITEWTRSRLTDEVIETAAAWRVPVTPIGNGATLPAQEPFASRRVFTREWHHIAPRPPVRFALQEASPALELARAPDRPLAGLRVVDFTAFWAGPFATQYLATMGADVVKIESIRRPDFFRFVGTVPGREQWFEKAPLFHANNAGKRSVTLELDTDAGLALARRLVASADVVIENFTPRVLEGFGLGHDDIASINPNAVVVRMPAFGLDGPWRDRPGFAQTVEQASGMAWVTGYADDPPRIPRGPGDPLAGMHAVYGVLAALLHRFRGGGGGLVEVPLCDVAVNLTVEQVLEYDAREHLLTRDGNANHEARIQGVYRCAGSPSWLAVSVVTPEQFTALVSVVGDDGVEGWCGTRPARECEAALLAAGVPAAVVVDDSAIGQNEQLRARGFFETVEHPVAGTTELPTWPFHFDGGFNGWYRAAAPLLGEHNDDVLGGELGLDADELAKLRADGVIGEAPMPEHARARPLEGPRSS